MFLTAALIERAVHVYPNSPDSLEDGERKGEPTEAPLAECAFCKLSQCEQTFVDEGVGLVIHSRRTS